MFFIDQLKQFAFAHHRVGQVHSCELHLSRVIDAKGSTEPIVQRAMVFEFKCADRMRDAFDGIALSMCPVVHWIDAPSIACTMMMSMHDAIQDGIPKVQVGCAHIDFRAKRSLPVHELAILHAFEQIHILFDRAISKRAVASRFSQRTTIVSHLICIQVANEGVSFADEL